MIENEFKQATRSRGAAPFLGALGHAYVCEQRRRGKAPCLQRREARTARGPGR